ncbi:hypothetical protein N658DRAFT_555491 [Parathielavia hyrcaniae]|uniref:Uncharacterized protein n=1 Tax=Parathielavia hyrcaniae TaxID=113614 RepID=A0AAN6QAM6_9PEZI|nr:hypothetical protein N658DRAFT_555491 [Parathielavia hyrcaniae]
MPPSTKKKSCRKPPGKKPKRELYVHCLKSIRDQSQDKEQDILKPSFRDEPQPSKKSVDLLSTKACEPSELRDSIDDLADTLDGIAVEQRVADASPDYWLLGVGSQFYNRGGDIWEALGAKVGDYAMGGCRLRDFILGSAAEVQCRGGPGCEGGGGED